MSKHLQFLTILRAACVDGILHFISTEIRTLGKLQEGYLFHMHFFLQRQYFKLIYSVFNLSFQISIQNIRYLHEIVNIILFNLMMHVFF